MWGNGLCEWVHWFWRNKTDERLKQDFRWMQRPLTNEILKGAPTKQGWEACMQIKQTGCLCYPLDLLKINCYHQHKPGVWRRQHINYSHCHGLKTISQATKNTCKFLAVRTENRKIDKEQRIIKNKNKKWLLWLSNFWKEKFREAAGSVNAASMGLE